MGFRVKDAMSLQSFKDMTLICGEGGIGRNINSVGILDHEIGSAMAESFQEGDFLLSNLYPLKDTQYELFDLVKELSDLGISGLAIKSVYFTSIPVEILDYCNEHDFPIFTYPLELFTENIIYDVINALRHDEYILYLSSKVQGMLDSKLSGAMVKKVALEINDKFMDLVHVAYLSCDEDPTFLISKINNSSNRDIRNIALLIDNNVLIIVSSDGSYVDITDILAKVGINTANYLIGVSDEIKPIEELDIAIKEAVYAQKAAGAYDKKQMSFKHIGLNKVIIPMFDSPWLKDYYNSLITPILEYDKKHESELLKTACIYVNNDGDINKTAKMLFQHGNTTRYRIKKIKEILSIDKDLSGFYEQLSFMVRVYLLDNKIK